MFYIKQDEDNRNAIDLLDEVIKAHFEQKTQKESELLEKYHSLDKSDIENFNKEMMEIEEEVKSIESKIAGILYARDYVRFKLKHVL